MECIEQDKSESLRSNTICCIVVNVSDTDMAVASEIEVVLMINVTFIHLIAKI